ncbi:hypothetical protein ABZ894_18360 [Nocardia beijingensis]|uniref:hypothetical protein n=1 Tax=Nocardia beijingensis TaxID=95162 RepID=UPI0033F37109
MPLRTRGNLVEPPQIAVSGLLDPPEAFTGIRTRARSFYRGRSKALATAPRTGSPATSQTRRERPVPVRRRGHRAGLAEVRHRAR